MTAEGGRARKSVRIAAPAKLNLYLEVLGRRSDGFHTLETVFQTIDLHDVVEVAVEPSGEGVELVCDDDTVPAGERNLAWRAAVLWQERRGDGGRIEIRLHKRVPQGAGLGGGSSDAGAVLRALQHMAERPLPRDETAAVALALGSDVPFFLLGGTAHALGRGEILTPLPDLPALPVTVIQPRASCATPAVFDSLTQEERGPRKPRGAGWWAGRADPAAWLHNRLTDAAIRVAPEIRDVMRWAAAQGAPVVLTGSGSACVALGHLPDPPPPWRCRRTRLRPRARLDDAGEP